MGRDTGFALSGDIELARWTTGVRLGSESSIALSRLAAASGVTAALRDPERSARLGAMGKAIALAQVGGRLVDRLARLPLESAPRVQAQSQAAQRAACDLAALHNVELEVRGHAPSSPAILVANHLSYVDAVVVTALVPSIALARHELARWPWLGRLARSTGAVFVDPRDPQSGARALRRIRRALLGGVSVLHFPEGEPSWGDDVRPFKRGVFGLAQRLEVPVVPVRISYVDRDVAWVGDESVIPHYLRLASRPRVRAMVAFGPPLDVVPKMDAADVAELARRAVQSLAYA